MIRVRVNRYCSAHMNTPAHHIDDAKPLHTPATRSSAAAQPWSAAAQALRESEATQDGAHQHTVRRVMSRWADHTVDELRGDASATWIANAGLRMAKATIIAGVGAVGRVLGWSEHTTSQVLTAAAAGVVVGLFVPWLWDVWTGRELPPDEPAAFSSLTASRRAKAARRSRRER